MMEMLMQGMSIMVTDALGNAKLSQDLLVQQPVNALRLVVQVLWIIITILVMMATM